MSRGPVAAGRFGSAEDADGIELMTGGFGTNFPGGLFVAQDGHNQPFAQNFKLVSWLEVRKALAL